MFHDIRQTDKAVRIQDREHAHDRCHHCPKHCGKSRATNTESRKPEVPIDQQIIKNDIHCIGCHISTHGNLRISRTPLRGIDSHLDTVKKHPAHHDLKIRHRAVMCFGRRAAETDDRSCKNHKNYAHDHCGSKDKSNRGAQNAVCILRIFLTAPSGSQCGNRHIRRKKQS